MKKILSSAIATFGIVCLLALAGFNPIGNFPGVKEAAQHRVEVQQIKEQQQQARK